MRYVIIGGSAAGVSCATRIKELEPDSEVIILSEEERPYSRIALPHILFGVAKKEDIFLPIPQGVKFLGGKRVKAVSPAKREIGTEEGEQFKFDKLLIAAGAKAQLSEFEGNTSPLVFTVRNLPDVQQIKRTLKNVSHDKIIISGAGLVSIEMGDAFRKLGYKPIFLVSSNMVLSQILDEMGSEILQQDLKDKGIEIYFGEDIVRVKTEREGLSTETQSGREFKGALLIIGKGTSPNINFLSSSGIEVDRGILVDELLKTNREEIFAAGDVCQGYDIVHRNKRVNALWPVAIEQGRNAAMNMTRFHIRYKGSVARNILTAFGNTLFTAGLSSSRDNGLEIYYRKKLRRYSRIVLRDGKLVGAIFLNVEINPGVYISAIERELDVHKLKDVLLSGSLSLAHLYPS